MSTQAEAMPVFPGYARSTVDDEIAYPDLYATEEIHDVYAKLRKEDPFHPDATSKFSPLLVGAEARRHSGVAKNHQIFVNRMRAYLSPKQGEDWILNTAGDTHLFRMLVVLGDPIHMKLRALTQN